MPGTPTTSTGPAAWAHALHEVLEPLHTPLYFAAEVHARFEGAGIDPRTTGYFTSRAAPMGRVGAGTVAGTFFNFNPGVVGMFLPAGWDQVSPEAMLDLRAAGMQDMYDRVGGPTDGLAEASDLLAEALAACDHAGRPLAAANAEVPLPEAPFARLSQHVATVREYRGDGHVALLVAEGLGRVDALVLYTAWTRKVSERFLKFSRGWDDDAWAGAQARLRARGLLDDEGGITRAGRELRDGIEARTDELAAAPFAALGEERCRRLYALLQPMAQAIGHGEVFPKPYDVPATFEDALAA